MIQLLQVHGDGGAAHVLIAGGRGTAKDEDILDIRNVLDGIIDQFGGAFGIVQRGAGRQFDRDGDAAAVVGRDEGAGNAHQRQHREADGDPCGDEGDVIAANGKAADVPRGGGGLDEPQVGAGKGAVLVVMFGAAVRGTHQVGGHHRGDQTRHQQREHHGDGDGDAELAEILAGNTGHEADGHKDRDDGGRGGDHGKADFIGSLDCGAVGGFAHADVAGDILDLDNRVIDKDAGGEGEGQEGHKVERKAQHVHHPEGRDGGQRQGDGRDQGGTPVAQKDHHHDHGQQGPLKQGVNRGLIVAIGEENRVIDLFDGHQRIFGADHVQLGIHHLGHRNFGGAFGAEHREGDNLFVVQFGKAAQFLVGILDLADVGQHDMAARGQGDGGGGEFGDGGGVTNRADGLFARAKFGLAAAKVGVGQAKLRRHRLRGDAKAVEPDRIERNTDFAVSAAVTIDPAHTGAALQFGLHDVVDEIRHLLEGH